MLKLIKQFRTSIEKSLEQARQNKQLDVVDNPTEPDEPTLNARLQSVSADEQFAVALCAPYREVYSRCIGSWAGKSAVTLYQIELPADDIKSYTDILKRDFDVVDKTTALDAISSFNNELEQGTAYAKAYQYLQQQGMLHGSVKEAMKLPDNEHSKKSIDAVLSSHASLGLGAKGGDAFRIAVIAHVASAAGALGYLSYDLAMQQLLFVSSIAKQQYSSWQQYSDSFTAGQRAWGMQGLAGEKVLAGSIKKLHEKSQSPWLTLGWV